MFVQVWSTGLGLVGALLYVGAWTVTELVRYSFYTFQAASWAAPYALVWLRYSLFIVLYPIGVGV